VACRSWEMITCSHSKMKKKSLCQGQHAGWHRVGEMAWWQRDNGMGRFMPLKGEACRLLSSWCISVPCVSYLRPRVGRPLMAHPQEWLAVAAQRRGNPEERGGSTRRMAS
jgi:hypothetical protein